MLVQRHFSVPGYCKKPQTQERSLSRNNFLQQQIMLAFQVIIISLQQIHRRISAQNIREVKTQDAEVKRVDTTKEIKYRKMKNYIRGQP